MVAGAVLLGGIAHAQTATTTSTTTSTTSTTVPPHPFSPATAACVHTARHEFGVCRSKVTGSTCRTQFEAALPSCFKVGAGVTCASRCTTREATCLSASPTAKKTCRKNCRKTHTADVQACRRISDGDNLWAGGDAACLTTAQANLDLCYFVCSQAAADCHTSLKFCVANCANQ